MDGGIIERDQRSGFLIVQIVASRPHQLGGGGHGPVPLGRGRAGRDGAQLGFRAAIAEGLVSPADAVVIHGDGIEV